MKRPQTWFRKPGRTKALSINVEPEVYKQIHDVSLQQKIFMRDILHEAITNHLKTLKGVSI